MKLFQWSGVVTAALLLTSGCSTSPSPSPSAEDFPGVVVSSVAVAETPVALVPHPPQSYTVVRGDTLWDIARFFLEDPWRWPEVWQNNPEVENPHLIYPGDLLILSYVEGRPVISRNSPIGMGTGTGSASDNTSYPTVKLRPQIRTSQTDRAISTIPADIIAPFLIKPRVITADALLTAPYVVSSVDGHLIAGTGNRLYVRGLQNRPASEYVVVRQGAPYINPNDEDDILGYEAIHVAEGRVTRLGDPATLLVTRAEREILNGDRILDKGDHALSAAFLPRAPTVRMNGRIIAVVDGVSQIGQYAIVVLDLGRQTGIEPGHVLAALREGEVVRDRVLSGFISNKVQLPDEKSGHLMIFRVFERVSFALVMEASYPLHILDRVTNP